jgi:alcohol/geraniol dehydrogenase (NADP+)
MIRAYASQGPRQAFSAFEYDPGSLGADEIEIKITSCGICHSDLSMLGNEWGMTSYPFVPGHEIVGTVAARGERVSHLAVGQCVGLGWYSRSCLNCNTCMHGDHNLCAGAQGVIVGRHGGFADRVRCQAAWAVPLPAGVNPKTAGPLFCGGITVFNPIVQFDVRPTDRVGVIGIGGLGHLAIRFLRAWGCEVTAFSSSSDKENEARDLGSHHFVNSRDSSALQGVAGRYDFIISTVNVPLDWGAYLSALGPRGRLHMVGAVLEPIPVPAFGLIPGQKSVSGTPLGSPAATATMLDFCARHRIEPVCEHFPMSRVNDAFERLKSGKTRYRIVLDAV